jgi:rhamnose transport system substrate-binding protein
MSDRLRISLGPLLRWETGLALVVVIIGVVGASVSSEFFTSNNIFNLGLSYGEIAIMTLPMTLIVISGEIDLSVASILGMSSALLGYLWARGWPMIGIFGLVAVVGLAAGAVNGLLITRLGLPSLAVTIGTLAVYRGIATILLGPATVADFPTTYTNLGVNAVPFTGNDITYSTAVFVVLAIIFGVVLHATPFGRSVYAMGASAEAAQFAGIRVKRIKTVLFMTSGLVCALAGVLLTSVPLALASILLAACSSSGSSSPPSGTSSSAASSSSATSSAAAGLKTGLKVFVIPKNLGNNYFTTADSANSGGAIAALQALGETGTETSGTAATPASQIPAIQAAISKGANALIVSATDPTALCPTLNAAMKRGVTVVTYDSDAPTCRNLFINQASTAQIGTSEVDLLAKEINDTGDIAIVSAAASATNQNAWIGYMKQELAKYSKMKLVATVYGNDDPTTATQVTQGLLEQYPNLKGIISPTTVGIAAAAAVLDSAKYRGKIALTGLGTPDSLKKYVSDGTIKSFELWNPANLGYLAGYAAVEVASGKINGTAGQTFTAGKLGSFTVGADKTVLLGPPFVFTAANIGQFNF